MSGELLTADDAWRTVRRYGLGRLLSTSFVRFRYGDGFSHARAFGLQLALATVPLVIAGAGLSAALPGVVAAHSELPVIGVPLTSSKSVAGGLDALLSIAQMPPGVPVACVGVDNARNAAVLAARILAG